MARASKRVVLLAGMIAIAGAVAFTPPGSAQRAGSTGTRVIASRHGSGLASARLPAGSAGTLLSFSPRNVTLASALKGVTNQPGALPPAQASPTPGPYQDEVSPPIVSEPVPPGSGLFDEITNRLLSSLLNIN